MSQQGARPLHRRRWSGTGGGVLVVTWNVNSLRMRLGRVLAFLERHRPDVVCTQEIRVCPLPP
ncbi:endonuclease/exonuclease/phosphatase family protein [Nonomuraea muscovyensis]|uniref:endonuclease/exonuclease/phosphatase family protein n=1 Tax=Nonomuraea muscovyensis TaxID=1124761 RepID=UPI0035E4627A